MCIFAIWPQAMDTQVNTVASPRYCNRTREGWPCLKEYHRLTSPFITVLWHQLFRYWQCQFITEPTNCTLLNAVNSWSWVLTFHFNFKTKPIIICLQWYYINLNPGICFKNIRHSHIIHNIIYYISQRT